MYPKKMLAGVNGIAVTADQMRSYKTADERALSTTAKPLNTARNYLPGLRPVEIDFEVYFRDAFFGQTF